MGNEKEMYPKANFRMKVTLLEKQDGGEGLKVVASKWVKGNGKEFRESIKEDRANGAERTIEIVDGAPEKFKINQIYMLRDRNVVWVYTEA